MVTIENRRASRSSSPSRGDGLDDRNRCWRRKGAPVSSKDRADPWTVGPPRAATRREAAHAIQEQTRPVRRRWGRRPAGRYRGGTGPMPRRQAPGVAGPRSAPVVPFEAPGNERPDRTGGAGGGERSGAPPPRPLRLVAAYARVSSDRQDKEQTIDSQVDALRRAAEQRGWHPAPDLICLDEGRSGATLARPGLDRLRDLVAEGTCATVLVCSPDRLARSYAYQVLVIDEFARAGCEVAFLNHAFGDSPEQQMLLQMQGVFAEYERALIQDRTRRGRLFWARQGRVNWGGTPTYGYRLSGRDEPGPRRLVVEESEAAVVRQLYRWLVEEQLSSYAIQRRLIERGVPTRQGGGRGWAQSTVIRILSNSSYKGQGWYNRRRAADRVQPHGKTDFKDLRPGDRAARPSGRWRSGSRCRCPPSSMPSFGAWPRSSWPATANAPHGTTPGTDIC